MGDSGGMGAILVSELLKILMQAVVGSLIAAIFLRWAASIVVKDSPTYGLAYRCSFLSVLINGLLGLGVGLIAGFADATDGAINALSLGMLPVSILIAGAIVSRYLSVTYGKGLLIVTLQIVLSLLVVGIPIVLFLLLAE